MIDHHSIAAVELIKANRHQIMEALTDAFVRHAIDNRGFLTSPRQSMAVVETFLDAVENFLSDQMTEHQLTAQASQFAEQGMALICASAILRALNQTVPGEVRQLAQFNNFQILFMEKMAEARETLQQRGQERAQSALQQALHNQLEQQIASHEAQKAQNEALNQILQLTARLNLAADEASLFLQAIKGFQEAIGVTAVYLYGFDENGERFYHLLNTTGTSQQSDEQKETDLAHLTDALQTTGEQFQYYRTDDQQEGLRVTLVLQTRSRVLGGMIVDNDEPADSENEPYFILLRTFAQNLTSLWSNRYLLLETQQRTRELEILHGRYLDSIWSSEQSALQAEVINSEIRIDRNAHPTEAADTAIPLKIGEYQIGDIQLPTDQPVSEEDQELLEALIREMGSALNNAYFLQTAQSYSNQLSLAADVSRAATTILDQDHLIQEVVNLIRNRFNFYYVGLFLVDNKTGTAVLQAGTGIAGERMVAENYNLAVGGASMIGTAVATGDTRVEPDVTLAQNFTRNPFLPETQSELALPLRTRSHTIGALTVQSKSKNAFSQEGITVLQSLADQMAIAIENAGLFARSQQNLAESTRLFATSQRITEASQAIDVYQALVDYAADSELVDLAQLFVADRDSPDHLISPTFWSHMEIKHDPDHRYIREKMPYTDRLLENEIIRVEDGQTDPQIDPVSRKLFSSTNIRSATLVPIHYEEEWLGTLALDRTTAVPLTDQELQPFLTLSSQAAIILYNQQLLRQTETLYRIGRLLNQSISRDDAMDITAREVADYVGAVQCRIVTFDLRTNVATLEAEHGPLGSNGSFQFSIPDDYIYHRLSQKYEPFVITSSDDSLTAETIKRHLTDFRAQASLIIPASNQQELMGYLAIDTTREQRPFTQTNIIFAQTVVDQLVTQLENIKLLDEALQRAQELITLNQVQTNISHFLNPEELAQSVYQQVSRLLDNTIFILAQYNHQTNEYQTILSVAEGIVQKQQTRTLHPDDPLFHFLQQNQYRILDSQTELMQQENHQLQTKPQSGLWIPLRREGQTTGLICVQSYNPLAYNEHDVQMLRSIATHTNLAFHNAELFTRIQTHNEELMELDSLKTQFLANMSHELRTPLNSIIGFSRVILKGIDGPITTEQEEDLTSIYINGQHLLTLINEILDMSKIEAGKMTLTFEEVDLLQATESVHNTVRGLLQSDQVKLTWNIQPDLPPIMADPIRIRQILINLLSNAAKYTEEGEIKLEVLAEDDHIQIIVSDTGAGIDEQDFDKIFVAFEQADSSTTRAVGGTGLGLPITKWLVEMHHGQISFESKLNKGTTFHVVLPRQHPSIVESLEDRPHPSLN